MAYKLVKGGYIEMVCDGELFGGVKIANTEYDEIMSVTQNRPTAPDGHGYRLREDLTWELYELPVVEISDEITDEEAYNIIMGVEE